MLTIARDLLQSTATPRRTARAAATLLLALALAPTAFAQVAPRTEVTLQSGFINLDSGLSDRAVGIAEIDLIRASGFGTHATAVGESREEDAAFFIGGVSWNTPRTVSRLRLGTSTENDDILPEFYAELGFTYISPPADGYTVSPTLTHRRYRNGAEETALALQGTRYFAAGGDRLWIAQGFGRGYRADPGDNSGFSVGASLAYGRYNSWSIGLLVEGGDGGYDVIGSGLPPAGVTNSFASVRPFASLRVNDRVELFSRVEYYDTELYDSLGLFVGAKITLSGA